MTAPDEKKTPSYDFPKSARILKREEFVKLGRVGRKIRVDHFLAIEAPGKGEVSRLGVTATRKIGNAAVRSRLKRQVREFFRHNRHRLKKNRDINIIAHQSAAGLTSAEISESLEKILKIICRASTKS
ncbi:Ribonuclease P protein component [Candidatus Desulfarcum epimagneticum]|uniref:Ribonuclease P protein component n=1 Tax=uncultured Desulfobacteraceae bacterium TaxID=218296 RepID=A0A484HFH0_9BACT|nr:Ribonuclease P protein component [uncultured Desulfobacteraceae bacterium]